MTVVESLCVVCAAACNRFRCSITCFIALLHFYQITSSLIINFSNLRIITSDLINPSFYPPHKIQTLGRYKLSFPLVKTISGTTECRSLDSNIAIEILVYFIFWKGNFLCASIQCHASSQAYPQQTPDSAQHGRQPAHGRDGEPLGGGGALAPPQSAAQQAQTFLRQPPSRPGECHARDLPTYSHVLIHFIFSLWL